MAKSPAVNFDLRTSLLSTFATNNRIDQYLIENVPPEAWSAKPPEGKGRTIAAMAAHIHDVRLMWLKAADVPKLPAKLTNITSTQIGARTPSETSFFDEGNL